MRNLIQVCSFGVMLAAAAICEAADEPPTVRVTGTGKAYATPDIAEVSIGVTTQAPTAQAALAQNNTDMTALVASIKAGGVADKDIQTSQIQVNPQYSNPPQQPREDYVPKVIGYRISNTVHVKVREIKGLGPLLDAVIRSGANQIFGISFRIADPEKLLDQARAKAVADALRKAKQLANEAGIKLGAVKSILEGDVAYPNPQPMAYTGRAMMMAAAPTMPVAAGEQELTVSLTMSFGILP